MVGIREKIQYGVEDRRIELMMAMFEVVKENYLSGHSQQAIKEYSSALAEESFNFQFRVAFLRPSEQEELYKTYFKGRRK